MPYERRTGGLVEREEFSELANALGHIFGDVLRPELDELISQQHRPALSVGFCHGLRPAGVRWTEDLNGYLSSSVGRCDS